MSSFKSFYIAELATDFAHACTECLQFCNFNRNAPKLINFYNKVSGLYTNLYTTYVGGQGQVPGKKYINSCINLP